MSTHNLCFEQKYEKITEILSENFHFLVVKFSVYLNRRVFVMSVNDGQHKKRVLLPYVSNQCPDQPAHSHSLISFFHYEKMHIQI